MGKINASKSQKEEAIVEQSEEEQGEQETEDKANPLYSDVVSNGSSLNSGTSISISGNSTGTTLLDSTFSGKRISDGDVANESKKQRRARLSRSSLQEVIQNSADTELLSSVAEINDLKLRIDQVSSDNEAFKKELTFYRDT
jgi:hypothetical protein